MVLTDLPFERDKLLHSRYDIIRRPESAPPPADIDCSSEFGQESKQYADFLKLQERKVGPDGFLDSARCSHTFQLKKNKESNSSVTRSKHPTLKNTSLLPNVVSLSARIDKDEKDYKKRMKVVEDHMWQHKQEERELKRMEGDIIKNQRAVRHTLRDFGTVVNKKRMAEDKKLNQSLEKFRDMQREYMHRKHQIGSERSQQNILAAQLEKAQSSKILLQKHDLVRQYQQKRSALELKRVEVMRLSQEFESKMRSKEEEQHKLKKDLAELAITLNQVAQKGRVQQFDFNRTRKQDATQQIQDDLESDRNLSNRIQQSDDDVKGAEMTKRKLSADLALTKTHLDIKKRDEQRHLTDTQIRLGDNTIVQRQLNEAARHAQMDLTAKQIDQNLEAHNVKRILRLQTSMKDKKEKEDSQQAVWKARFKARSMEAQRKKHQDSLKFFGRLVSKDEEKEQVLYNAVREAEYARQQKDQEVRRIQQRLLAVRAQHQQKLKQEELKVHQVEKELEQQLQKEKAELDKMHARREESYIQLQSHRLRMKEDQHLLQGLEREHNRLQKIATRSEAVTDVY